MIEIYENTTLQERLHYKKSPSGLDVYVIPKAGFSKAYAYFAFKFGGRDTERIVNDQLVRFPEGTAHFLEHKLFESQEKDLFKRFNARGATVNAYTNAASTVYYFSATEHLQENLQALLSMVQRLEITEADVEREKGIIGQEIDMYRDQADWQLYHRTLRALYHKHPLRQSVAGDEASIAAIDMAVLNRAYRTFYTPGNSFVLVVGDVNPSEVMAWVESGLTTDFINRSARLEAVSPSEPEAVRFDRLSYPFALAYSKSLMGFKDTVRPLYGKQLYRRSLILRLMQELFFGRASELYNRLYQSGIVNATFGVDYLFDVDYGFSLIGGDNMDPEAVLAAIRTYGIELDSRLAGEDAHGHRQELERQFEQVKRRAIGRYLMSYNGLEFIGHHFVTHILKGINPLHYPEIVEQVSFEEVLAAFESHVLGNTPALVSLEPIKSVHPG